MAKLLEPFAGDHAELSADRLICGFGSLGRALTASPEQLNHILKGNTELAAIIVAARSLFVAGLREEISHSAVSIDDPAFQEYLHLTLGKAATERLHATFVTQGWGYLADETLAWGSVGSVEANLRIILKRAFDLGAHGVILAHNHPSGSSEPSIEDIAITGRMAELFEAVGIALLDHLIVGGKMIVSLRRQGLL